MTYNPNIPLAGDIPSQSQADLLNNFTQLNTQFSTDHVAFDAVSNNGYHKKITFQNVLGSNPDLASPIASLYTKAVSGLTQLFFQNDSSGTDVVQLTHLSVASSANSGTAGGTIYSLVTPWGLTFYMGQTAAFTGSPATVVFPKALSAIYTSSVSPNTNSSGTATASQSTTGLSMRASLGLAVNWFAIGAS